MKKNTTYILIGIAILVAILLFVFKDKIFRKKSEPKRLDSKRLEPKRLESIPLDYEEELASIYKNPVKIEITNDQLNVLNDFYLKNQKELDDILNEIMQECKINNDNDLITESCFNSVKSKLPIFKNVIINFIKNNPIPDSLKRPFNIFLERYEKIEKLIKPDFFDKYLKQKTYGDIKKFLNISNFGI